MDAKQERKGESFQRVCDCLTDRFQVGVQPATPAGTPPATPATPSEFASLVTPLGVLKDVIVRLNQHALDQNVNKTQTGESAREIKPLRVNLLDHLRGVATAAKTLRGKVPGIAILAAPPVKTRTSSLVDSATAFAEKAKVYEPVLVEAGLAPTFLADLATATAALQASIAARGNAVTGQAAATKGLKSEIVVGNDTVHMIDATMTRLLRNSPADLAAWRSAKRVTKTKGSSASTTSTSPAANTSAPAPTQPSPVPTATVAAAAVTGSKQSTTA